MFIFLGSNYVFELENKLHKSSCTETYYQCNLQSTKTNMLLELFVQIITEPCFNILRTKVIILLLRADYYFSFCCYFKCFYLSQEQLGYIVFSGLRRSNGAQGFRVIVQSDRHPKYIDERVEAFLTSMGVSRYNYKVQLRR